MVALSLFPAADPAVESFIRGYCGWHIAPSMEETVTLNGSDWLLPLPSLHVTAVTAVSVAGTVWPADQMVWAQAGFLRGNFGSGLRSVVVTFTHGYDVCPPELEDVARRLARAAATPAGATVRVGQVSISGGTAGAGGLDSYCQAVLDRYKLPPRP